MILFFEWVRDVNSFGKVRWIVRRKMKPPFLGSYETLERKKDAVARCDYLNKRMTPDFERKLAKDQ